jgi:seryl-tRNA synthetase
MLDVRALRNDLDGVVRNLARRGYAFDRDSFERLEAERKKLQVDVEAARQKRNDSSKSIGRAKAAGEDVAELMREVGALAEALAVAETRLADVARQLDDLLAGIPNLLHESVPEGKGDAGNVEVRRWGVVRPLEKARDHVDVGEGLGMIDLEGAAKVAGSRFVVLHGALARLHRALIQFMLDVHTREHGYTEAYVPYLANERALFGTSQLPKFERDLFAVAGETRFFLIPTAEVPLTNLVRESIIDAERLPIKLVAHTPCFRSEAGSYGKDTRGMFRQHQFEKVELVQVVRPEDSYSALEALTGHAEAVLQRLELPYRVVALCAGDIGFGAAKTYDIEVWLPGQRAYREISSCSNFEGFQARRMQARWRNPATGKPETVHTLNGSGLAAGRALIAVLENYQEPDGSVRVPTALQPYMDGLAALEPGLVGATSVATLPRNRG